MADSNITKQALSGALKALMEEKPFEKISVSDICEKCRMNRKSFYYHFRDKYDLANWIFDVEFIELTRKHSLADKQASYAFDERWGSIEIVCEYFYENRNFYRKLLKVEGQNSFSEHFRDFLHPLLRAQADSLLGGGDIPTMVYDFMVDGIECAIERWLRDKNCITAQEFVFNLKKLVHVLVVGFSRRAESDPKWLEEI